MVMTTPPFVLGPSRRPPAAWGWYWSQNVLSPAEGSVAGIRTDVTPVSLRSGRLTTNSAADPDQTDTAESGSHPAALRNVGEKYSSLMVAAGPIPITSR
jgi:hypothetical protein